MALVDSGCCALTILKL